MMDDIRREFPVKPDVLKDWSSNEIVQYCIHGHERGILSYESQCLGNGRRKWRSIVERPIRKRAQDDKKPWYSLSVWFGLWFGLSLAVPRISVKCPVQVLGS
jgi:hypothetical protein